MARQIYLDYAAATPVHPEVFTAMQPFFYEQFYNPSASYQAGQNARRALESARRDVAYALGARGSEITFTAGGTESTNLAIHGIMQLHPGAELVVSAIEHEAVLAPSAQYSVRYAPVDKSGLVDMDALQNCISDATVLISVMYANNEVGTIQPLRAVGLLAESIRKDRKARGIDMPLYVHTDACQAGLYLDVHVSRLGVDLLTLNGGKMYGPKQSGILYAASHVRFRPQIVGGGQEHGMRSGTENVAQAVGFATALVRAQADRHERIKNMLVLQKNFQNNLQQAVPTIVINGAQKHRLPNIIHVTIPGQDNERMLYALDERGIMAAAGSACSASDEEPSHVLRAMGLSDDDARASLRFTMGDSTTETDLNDTVRMLAEIIQDSY